jgi:hypothetical protein
MPWRKRLGDLAQLIEQANATYFEPDLFRINVNNAIQTARTVTFLIQKHKASIKDFDEWYLAHVLEPFKNDRIMNWLKESRNRIEKEGDLEVYSECTLETVFSYTDEGPRISLKKRRTPLHRREATYSSHPGYFPHGCLQGFGDLSRASMDCDFPTRF